MAKLKQVTGCEAYNVLENNGPLAERQAVRTLLSLRGLAQNEKETYLVLHNIACIYGRLSEADEQNRTELQHVALDLLKQAVQWATRFGEEQIEMQNILREDEQFFGSSLRATEEFLQLSALN